MKSEGFFLLIYEKEMEKFKLYIIFCAQLRVGVRTFAHSFRGFLFFLI